MFCGICCMIVCVDEIVCVIVVCMFVFGCRNIFMIVMLGSDVDLMCWMLLMVVVSICLCMDVMWFVIFVVEKLL